MSEHLSFYLSLRGCTHKTVAVAPSLLLFRRPHSGVRLSGAVGQRRIKQVLFENGGPLVVFCVISLGENKGLLLQTCWGTKRSVLRFKSAYTYGHLKIYIHICTLRTHPGPWFLSLRLECTGKSRSCFCASSDTLFPPDLCSAGDSLSRSLREGEVDSEWTKLEPFKSHLMVFSL